jgi:hypothetical protein
MILADACVKPTGGAWLDGAATLAWYTSRGAKPPPNEIEPVCREITVGPKGEAALFCERIQHETRGQPGTPLHTYRVLTLVSVRTVRAKKAITLLEAPLQVDLLDKEDIDEGPLFALQIDEPDGSAAASEITLREPKEGACAEAALTLKSGRDNARASKDDVMTAWARIDEDLRARICGAAGSYRWQNDRFVRTPARDAAARSRP